MATKKKALAIGDAVTIDNRMYAVVTKAGKIIKDAYSNPAVFFSRESARGFAKLSKGENIIRLRDIVGDVVR